MDIEEMIKVMQACADGEEIEARLSTKCMKRAWGPARGPIWDWSSYSYRVKPKPAALETVVFAGCPIMTINPHVPCDAWRMIIYRGDGGSGLSAGSKTRRLPTIEESPRNTWLAHNRQGVCPPGAEDLMLLVWYRTSLLPGRTDRGSEFKWDLIDKFMILDRSRF